jgi:hypothetical protein
MAAIAAPMAKAKAIAMEIFVMWIIPNPLTGNPAWSHLELVLPAVGQQSICHTLFPGSQKKQSPDAVRGEGLRRHGHDARPGVRPGEPAIPW